MGETADEVNASGRRLFVALQSMVRLHFDWQPGGRATRRLCEANDAIVTVARAAMKDAPASFRPGGEEEGAAAVDVSEIICRLAAVVDESAQARLEIIQRLTAKGGTAEAFQDALAAAEALLGDQPKLDRPRG